MQGRALIHKRLILTASLVSNLGILFFFKYYDFFAESARLISQNTLYVPSFNLLLPVGISFYTFQAIGYSIDVYYERVQAERSLIAYALFVTFFPQLVAGPIERSANLLPQFKVSHEFDYDRVTSGLRRAAWGLFKKVAIADRLALYVNAVYDEPGYYGSAPLALATFFFAIQIYCDFSGYSDIALGTARVLGFKLTDNFRQPYFSRSVTEFWRRWHISLSSWLRDYIYIPLGGSRKGAFRQKLNLMLTFLLSGLWHGAAWHYVIWGALHGGFLVIERSAASVYDTALRRLKLRGPSRLVSAVQGCLTFALVCFAWIFFRAGTIHDAVLICGKLTALPADIAGYIQRLSSAGVVDTILTMFQLGQKPTLEFFGILTFTLSFLLIAVLVIVDGRRSGSHSANIRQIPLIPRWISYCALLLMTLISWNQTANTFIYFTF